MVRACFSCALLLAATMMTRMAAAEWEVLYPNAMTIAMGVDATDNGGVYVSGARNGVGAGVLRSFDGGESWESCPITTPEGMFMDIGMGSNTFGVCGGLGMYHRLAGSADTTDGYSWASTPGTFLIAAYQSCASTDNSTYYLVGAWQDQIVGGEYKEGIRASFDGGETVQEFTIPGAETWIRYGSFPSQSTWYVTCGYWPASKDERHRFSERQLNQHTKLFRSSSNNIRFEVDTSATKRNYEEGYGAEIMKTSDGGKTWTRVFSDFGNYYLNGIDCPTEDICIAVAEGNEGAYIFLTGDGGATWTQTGFFANGGLFNVDMLNEKEGWAVGVYFVGVTFNALFLQTIDGGLSWQESNTIENAYPNDIVVVNSGLAYSTAFLRSGSASSILVYRG